MPESFISWLRPKEFANEMKIGYFTRFILVLSTVFQFCSVRRSTLSSIILKILKLDSIFVLPQNWPTSKNMGGYLYGLILILRWNEDKCAILSFTRFVLSVVHFFIFAFVSHNLNNWPAKIYKSPVTRVLIKECWISNIDRILIKILI